MAYDARVLQILIISPGDVQAERDTISQIIYEWNHVNSRDRSIVLLPLRWETHASPELGQRPQAAINRQVVDYCDMAIGVFWTRLGTPTGEAESGSTEEINRVADAGKPVMLYFSRAKVDLQATDLSEYARLASFKDSLFQKALIESYTTITEFREMLTRQLALGIRDVIAEDSSSQLASNDESGLDQITLTIATSTAVDAKVQAPYTSTSVVELISPVIVNQEEIPDYSSPTPFTSGTGTALIAFSGDFNNKNYYRDVVEYFREYNLRRHLWLAVANSSNKSIRDIHLDVRIYASKEGIVAGPQALQAPSPSRTSFAGIGTYMPSPGLIATQSSGVVTVENAANNEWRAQIDIPIVQAQRTVIAPAPIPVKAITDGKIRFEATTYSSDSPPFTLSAEIQISVKISEMTYEDVLKQIVPGYSE